MSPRLARWLIALYPRAWRERYGPELAELVAEEPTGAHALADIAVAALAERLFNRSGLGVPVMQPYPASVIQLVRRPLALAPIVLSACGFALVVLGVELFGVHAEPDEGAMAHLFQLLVAIQPPLMALFALRWLPRSLNAALTVLGIQGLALACALVPVWAYGL